MNGLGSLAQTRGDLAIIAWSAKFFLRSDFDIVFWVQQAQLYACISAVCTYALYIEIPTVDHMSIGSILQVAKADAVVVTAIFADSTSMLSSSQMKFIWRKQSEVIYI